MTGVDSKHEQLDAYLDRELPADERAELEARLERDLALADELDRLREDRMTRAAAWRSLEPRQPEIERMVAAVGAAARRDALWRKRAGALKWVSAAAASVLLGVSAGWFGRTFMAPSSPPPSTPVATVAPEQHLFRVAITDESGNVLAVQKFDSIDRARAFTTDVRQWQQRQREVQDGSLILVGDRF